MYKKKQPVKHNKETSGENHMLHVLGEGLWGVPCSRTVDYSVRRERDDLGLLRKRSSRENPLPFPLLAASVKAVHASVEGEESA